MSATVADLATKVLQRLQVLDAEETASAADHQFVEDASADLHELLSAEGLVTWNSDAVIPTGAVIPMTAILAYQVAQEFGVPSNDLIIYSQRSESAKLELRRLGRGYAQPVPTVGEYY